jgi:hypothetical protein
VLTTSRDEPLASQASLPLLKAEPEINELVSSATSDLSRHSMVELAYDISPDEPFGDKTPCILNSSFLTLFVEKTSRNFYGAILETYTTDAKKSSNEKVDFKVKLSTFSRLPSNIT